ncbi:transcriptional regulator, ArsR family [Seinonella peptonophila]|uniref:Transcriptional regulator, ArsR family n=1 Tax=Seinonella peptonophila TaxID=112248 RepID=A0A1M4X241_9BACL|nr:metalloregulator ArsR/SmtB family transcription factor [Seinonella peptonophila]SHE87571.1 transcriptional regulator, ArsR family [Seinonella peptonophila]
MENDIFKALADPSRRILLDLLRVSDGQSLNQLCTPLDMSRFGVMKHLKILEEAGLITTRKVGREKLHFLNAVPIRHIYDRWISKYAEPWAIELTTLKNELESETKMEQKTRSVNRIAIKASPEQIWNALTNPGMTSKFWFNCAIESTWEIGSPFALWNGSEKKVEGSILEIDEPNRLSMSWRYLTFPGTENDSPSRVTWEIEPHADLKGTTIVTVVHDEYDQAANTAQILESGIVIVLSGMKTLLETGTTLIDISVEP